MKKNGDTANGYEHEKDTGYVLGSLCAISAYVVNDFYSTGIRLNFVIKPDVTYWWVSTSLKLITVEGYSNILLLLRTFKNSVESLFMNHTGKSA